MSTWQTRTGFCLAVVALCVLLAAGCTNDRIPTEPLGQDDPAGTVSADELNRLAAEQAAADEAIAAKVNGYQLYNEFAFYSQNDTWAGDLLGNSSTTTIGQAGCALTCMAMAYHKWGYTSLNPRVLNNWGKTHQAFSGPNIIWNKIDNYGITRTATSIGSGQLYEYVRRGWPVIVYVYSYRYHQNHAYLLYGFSRNGDGRFWAKDPVQNAANQNQPLEGAFLAAYVFSW
jgi:hypothetical protein